MHRKSLFISVFLITLLTETQFAAADYTITNGSTTEPAWIVYSVWRPASGGWPAGYRTEGWYDVVPGDSINVPVPAHQSWVYIRVLRADDTEIRPPDSLKRQSFQFWIHPSEEAFTVVEAENGDILKSDVNRSDLERAELYEYRNGGKHTIPEFHQEKVRILYFLPNDLFPLAGIETELNKLIKATQEFFAAEMHRHGFDGKTFTFETDQNGQPLIHWIDGAFADSYYHTDTSDKVLDEISEAFDLSQDLYLIFTDITSEFIGDEDTCGEGWHPGFEYWGYSEHWAIVPAFGQCLADGKGLPLVAHELGHAFGLEHDFRNDAYIMSYGDTPHQLAKCSAEWLDASKFFNARRVFSDEPTLFDEPILFESPPKAVRITFPIADIDGLQQAQLLIPTTHADLSEGVKLYGCQSLIGSTEATVEFVIPKAAVPFDDNLTLSVIDGLGNTERLTYTPVQADILPAVLKPAPAAPAWVQSEETIVFANYPNPFNPETWIPYQLAKPAEVTVSIYTTDGKLVRTLALGHQPAGAYQSKGRAAYWDGRNTQDEPVASGVYFYTLTAGDFTATRRMLIRK